LEKESVNIRPPPTPTTLLFSQNANPETNRQVVVVPKASSTTTHNRKQNANLHHKQDLAKRKQINPSSTIFYLSREK
jgi:hypothetical protein